MSIQERVRPAGEPTEFIPDLVHDPSPDTQEVRTSIILPAKDEEAALPFVLEHLLRVVDESCEIIVIDDGSTDGTAEVARQYPCRVICHQTNQGKGAAFRSGVDTARGEFIITMDADATYPPDVIPTIIELLQTQDLVRGIRFHTPATMPLVNRLGNLAFKFILGRILQIRGGDLLSGLYGVRREALNAMHLQASAFELEVEIAIRAQALRLSTAEISIGYGKRLGEKKLRAWRDGWFILRKAIWLQIGSETRKLAESRKHPSADQPVLPPLRALGSPRTTTPAIDNLRSPRRRQASPPPAVIGTAEED